MVQLRQLWRRGGRQDPRSAFAVAVRERLLAAGEIRPISYDPANFTLRIGAPGSGNEATVWLRNMFAGFAALSPAERPAALLRIVASIGEGSQEAPKTFDEAAGRLLPLVRAHLDLALVALRQKLDGDQANAGNAESRDGANLEIASRLLSPRLAVWLALDSENAITWVSANTLLRWGVPFETAFARALENLRARGVKPFVEYAPGLLRSDWADGYDTSRLLMLDLFEDLPVDGPPVAMALTRDVLLITDARNSEGLRAMARAAQQMLAHPRIVSPVPLVLEKGVWAPFRPDPGLAGGEALREVAEVAAGIDYAGQKTLLDALHAKLREDVYVATHSSRRDTKTGRYLGSFATWTKGVDTLLPRAQNLAFVDLEQRDMMTVAWKKAEPVVGHLLEATDLWPERFRVRRFPDKGELEMLRAEAIETRHLASIPDRFSLVALTRAKRFAGVLDIVTLIAVGWCLLMPSFHFPILIALLTPLPLIAWLTVLLTRGLFRLDEQTSPYHASVAAPFLLPGFALMVRALLDIEMLDWTASIVSGVALGAFLITAAVLADPSLRRRPATALISALLAAAYGFGTSVEVNALLDRSEPAVFVADVQAKHPSYGKVIRYLVKLGPWGPRTKAEDVTVSKALYDSQRPGADWSFSCARDASACRGSS